MAKLFISYRREDSGWHADSLYQALKPYFDNPSEDIFIDIDNIPFGVDFVAFLDEKVGQCEALLVVIGDRWLDARDPQTGQRRLDNPDDFVRIEIRSALGRDIPVVPVTIDDTPVPKAEDLPEDLKPLARRNGMPVKRLSFRADVERLVRGLPVNSRQPKEARSADTKPHTAPQNAVSPVARARQTAIEGGPVAERLFPLRLEGVPNWPESNMVAIPPGRFLMGSPKGERHRRVEELPQHEVLIDYPFALGQHTVTFAEWDAALAAGSGLAEPSDGGWGRDRRPVINISWEDSQDYLAWLNERLGLSNRADAYRLPSEAEWEYACRARTTTPYGFGETISKSQAQSLSSGGSVQQTVPVGTFPANAFGLYDIHGNVWEWCADPWHDDYKGAPTDGSVWGGKNSSSRVLRGGSWRNGPGRLRSAFRLRNNTTHRLSYIGFRIARTL